jgi:hypothetical protein
MAPKLYSYRHTVSSAITRVSLTRTGYSATDEQVKAANANFRICVLSISDFSDQCEDTYTAGWRAKFLLSDLILLRDFL